MRNVIFGVIIALLLLITSWWLGFLEIGVGMAYDMADSFTRPGSTNGLLVVFCYPLLVLMLLIVAIPFVIMPLAGASLLSWLGGFVLRRQGENVTPNHGWKLVLATVLCTVAFVMLARVYGPSPFDTRAPNHRPPVFALAFVAAANTAFSAYTVARILRKLTARPALASPNPAI